MERVMERLARVLLANRRRVLAGWALLCLVGALFAAGLPGRIVSGGEAPASSQSEVVARALARTSLPSLFVAVQVPVDTTPSEQARLTEATAAATRGVHGVTAVSPLPEIPPARPGGERVTVLNVSTSGGTDGAIKVAHALLGTAEALTRNGVSVHVGGFGAYRDELTVDSQEDLERAERVGLPIVLVVLLLTFGSLWAAALPLAIAVSALLMGLGGVGLASFRLPMSDFVTNSASMIGLALGVDYAMFLVQRVRELRHAGRSSDDAVREAMVTTGTAVLWSGITVVLAEATLLLVDSRSIRSAALGMVLVTVFAVATALVVAPVLISLLAAKVAPARRHSAASSASRGWRGWARFVTRRAPLLLIASVLGMVALAVPSARLHSTVNISGTSSLPSGSSVRLAYDLAGERYGPAAMSPILVLVDTQRAAEVRATAAVIAADHGVAGVTAQAVGDGRTAFVVTGRADPYSAEARTLVDRFRHGALASALPGRSVWVGGETAASIDATDAMFASLPKVGLALLLVVAMLLLLALRSVLLPLKAVLLVVLSLGASLGVLLLLTTTWIGSRLIGADRPYDIHPIVPITIVAITVALSTDYEVILISRIGEHFRRTGDNLAAVIHGIEHTGSVITSAAAIMVAVFCGFALADLPPLKQLGVGLAIAVLLDATVVRGVLVPAAMAVMGRANWWWPIGVGARRPRRRPKDARDARRAGDVRAVGDAGEATDARAPSNPRDPRDAASSSPEAPVVVRG